MLRFIDDLTNLSDNGDFEKNLKEVFPPELVLKKGNLRNIEISYLDFLIKVKHNQFFIQLRDKRDDLSFPVVRIPYLKINTQLKMFYSSYKSDDKDKQFQDYLYKQLKKS